MCGIWSLVRLLKNKVSHSQEENAELCKLFQDFMNLKHRGPDNSYFESYNNVLIGFHRLAIMDDTFKSNQPFIFEDENRTVIFICNGEIYNFKELIEEFGLSNKIRNDCMVIPELYMDMLKDTATDSSDILHSKFRRLIEQKVKGEFAFNIFEFDRLKNLRRVVACRDPVGVRPLYYSPVVDGEKPDCLFFTSEVKGGMSFPGRLEEFPPGTVHFYEFDEIGDFKMNQYSTDNGIYLTKSVPDLSEEGHLEAVRNAVLNSVRRRLAADKPLSFLLSGGVDSSLVAGLSAKILGKPIRTFCCSIKGKDGKGVGTDLKYARMVADHIGSTHTEVLFTEEEGLAAIPDVIRTIESWDTTTVRASVVQYLVCKYIGEHTDAKVLCVGEGADEICSSYLFNWYAPDGESLNSCAKEYVKNIHYYDVKRADRCIARWGLEGRVPLLDPEFIQAYWKIPGEKRMPTYKNMEKWWLRKAFDGTGVLPDAVLWRIKEAQSDACSSKERSWFSIIQTWVDSQVTDEELLGAAQKYPYCTPTTKEAYYYRRVFGDIFGEKRQDIIPRFWLPKWDKDGKEVSGYVDPSARTLEVYNALG